MPKQSSGPQQNPAPSNLSLQSSRGTGCFNLDIPTSCHLSTSLGSLKRPTERRQVLVLEHRKASNAAEELPVMHLDVPPTCFRSGLAVARCFRLCHRFFFPPDELERYREVVAGLELLQMSRSSFQIPRLGGCCLRRSHLSFDTPGGRCRRVDRSTRSTPNGCFASETGVVTRNGWFLRRTPRTKPSLYRPHRTVGRSPVPSPHLPALSSPESGTARSAVHRGSCELLDSGTSTATMVGTVDPGPSTLFHS